MWKRLGAIVLGVLAYLTPLAAEVPTGLEHYLTPAQITKLDWLVLEAQVMDFSKRIQWDQHGLVDSISVYAIENRRLVGMTVLVNEDRHVRMADDLAKIILEDVVVTAARLLQVRIPEVDHKRNVHAIFLTRAGMKNIGKYEDGQVRLAPRR